MRAAAATSVKHVAVVCPSTHLEQAISIAAAVSTATTVVAGGATRSDSVRAGLAALPDEIDVVLVHDAARCLTPSSQFDAVAAALTEDLDAIVPAVAVIDTIKEVDPDHFVVSTLDRSRLRAVQTPQGFHRRALESAHAQGVAATDDAGVVERTGGIVKVVDGDPVALKITTAFDLAIAETYLASELR